MHHDGEYEFTVGDLEQSGPQRHFPRDIEATRCQCGQLARQLRCVDRAGRQIQRDPLGRQHELVTDPVDLRIHGPQHLVPLDHIAHGRRQRRHVERARQPQRDGDVVGRRFRIQPGQEPHSLLSQRERRPVTARLRYRGRAFGPRAGPHGSTGSHREHCREGGDGRMVEHRLDRDLDSEGRAQPSQQPHGQQRIAAQFEEVIRGPHPLDPQQPLELLRDQDLGRARRCAILAPAQHRLG